MKEVFLSPMQQLYHDAPYFDWNMRVHVIIYIPTIKSINSLSTNMIVWAGACMLVNAKHKICRFPDFESRTEIAKILKLQEL